MLKKLLIASVIFHNATHAFWSSAANESIITQDHLRHAQQELTINLKKIENAQEDIKAYRQRLHNALHDLERHKNNKEQASQKLAQLEPQCIDSVSFDPKICTEALKAFKALYQQHKAEQDKDINQLTCLIEKSHHEIIKYQKDAQMLRTKIEEYQKMIAEHAAQSHAELDHIKQ